MAFQMGFFLRYLILIIFFIAFEHPILVDFSRLGTRKVMIFPKESIVNDFCMIFAKIACSIKVRKLLDFAFVFEGQNEENPFKIRIQKCVVLKHRI